MIIPEISINELADNIDSEDFYRRFGNPVMTRFGETSAVLLSFELYERLFGKVDLTKEKTIEMDEFITHIKEYLKEGEEK